MHAGIRCPYALMKVIARLLAGELLLKACESLKIAESSLFERSGENWSLLSATVAATTAFATVLTLAGLLSALALLLVLESTAVRKDDALGILVEFEHLELKLLIELGTTAVSLGKMLGSSEALYTIGESDDCALLNHLDDSALVNRTYSEDGLEYIPGILFELLVSE